jgi:hypothetical protein
VHAPHVVADTKTDLCNGVGLTGGNCNGGTASNSINKIIRTVVQVLGLIVGVAAVIFIIIGGLKYVTSSGDAQKATSARNTIIYAVVGLAVAALAEAIVAFVLTKV